MIQAAGDNSPVTKDSKLISQTIAEDRTILQISAEIRPIEFVTMLQIDPICDSDAVAFLMPRFREIASQCIRDGLVQSVCTAVVPEPVRYQESAIDILTELETICQVSVKGNRQIVGFEGMERDVDLVQSRGGKKHFLPLGKQGAVGGENYPEAVAVGKFQKSTQFWVAERFSHQMKIQEVRVGPQFGQKYLQIFLCHGPLLPSGAGAESAA